MALSVSNRHQTPVCKCTGPYTLRNASAINMVTQHVEYCSWQSKDPTLYMHWYTDRCEWYSRIKLELRLNSFVSRITLPFEWLCQRSPENVLSGDQVSSMNDWMYSGVYTCHMYLVRLALCTSLKHILFRLWTLMLEREHNHTCWSLCPSLKPTVTIWFISWLHTFITICWCGQTISTRNNTAA